MLSTLTHHGEDPAALARNLLFAEEPDVVWCIEADQSAAKVTWKRNLADGMKLKLGSISLVWCLYFHFYLVCLLHELNAYHKWWLLYHIVHLESSYGFMSVVLFVNAKIFY